MTIEIYVHSLLTENEQNYSSCSDRVLLCATNRSYAACKFRTKLQSIFDVSDALPNDVCGHYANVGIARCFLRRVNCDSVRRLTTVNQTTNSSACPREGPPSPRRHRATTRSLKPGAPSVAAATAVPNEAVAVVVGALEEVGISWPGSDPLAGWQRDQHNSVFLDTAATTVVRRSIDQYFLWDSQQQQPCTNVGRRGASSGCGVIVAVVVDDEDDVDRPVSQPLYDVGAIHSSLVLCYDNLQLLSD
jgi:hypothetical protein